MNQKPKYQRQSEEARREALIGAALSLVAEGGPQAATVRAIAERAEVTPGLIRHYFQTKEALLRAAYADLMARMTSQSQPVGSEDASPTERLARLVVASLRPPVMDAERLALWAGFMHQVRSDPEMRAVHETSYLDYRDLLQAHIAALPGMTDPARHRTLAIACNAVIDGLWLEGSALPHGFAPGEIVQIGLRSVGAILGVTLSERGEGKNP